MLRTFVRLAFPLLGLSAVPFLQSCTDRQLDRVEVPDFVQQMMDADFPADGRMHARARGTFRIEPTTVFCTFSPGYSLDTDQLNAALRRIGQEPYYGGGNRTSHRANASRHCIPGRSVFVRAIPTANRQGGHYKLVLAVWQGDAGWTGAIERLDGTRPEFASARPFRDVPPLTPWARRTFEREDRDHRAELSIGQDMVHLSRAVLSRVMRGRD